MTAKKYKFHSALLVDDNDLDNFINKQKLSEDHFAEKIYVHTSARSALEFLASLIVMGQEQSRFSPQVIIVDLNMPIMDGFEFLEEFSKSMSPLFKETKLAILTSSVFSGDKVKAAALSEKIVFLNKPLTSGQLSLID